MARFSRLVLAGLLLAAPAIVACQKAEVEPAAGSHRSNTQLLVGRWEFTQTTGGFAGQTILADPVQKREIQFHPNGVASFLLNGKVNSTARYSLIQRTSYLTGTTQSFLVYSAPAHGDSQFIERISPTELVLAHDANDGFQTYYTRTSN